MFLKEYAQIDEWSNQDLASVVKGMELGETGTVFRLYGLHDNWNERTKKRLCNHLQNLLPPDVVDDFVIYYFVRLK